MIGLPSKRSRPLDPRGAALAIALCLGASIAFPSAASAQQICAADLNNNGDAADEGRSTAWPTPPDNIAARPDRNLPAW